MKLRVKLQFLTEGLKRHQIYEVTLKSPQTVCGFTHFPFLKEILSPVYGLSHRNKQGKLPLQYCRVTVKETTQRAFSNAQKTKTRNISL